MQKLWAHGALGVSEPGPRASGKAQGGQEHPVLTAAWCHLPRASGTGLQSKGVLALCELVTHSRPTWSPRPQSPQPTTKRQLALTEHWHAPGARRYGLPAAPGAGTRQACSLQMRRLKVRELKPNVTVGHCEAGTEAGPARARGLRSSYLSFPHVCLSRSCFRVNALKTVCFSMSFSFHSTDFTL